MKPSWGRWLPFSLCWEGPEELCKTQFLANADLSSDSPLALNEANILSLRGEKGSAHLWGTEHLIPSHHPGALSWEKEIREFHLLSYSHEFQHEKKKKKEWSQTG